MSTLIEAGLIYRHSRICCHQGHQFPFAASVFMNLLLYTVSVLFCWMRSGCFRVFGIHCEAFCCFQVKKKSRITLLFGDHFFWFNCKGRGHQVATFELFQCHLRLLSFYLFFLFFLPLSHITKNRDMNSIDMKR